MLRKIKLLLVFALCAVVSVAQQGQGTIQGKVLDKQTGELLPFVNVVVQQNGSQKGGASTDFDGNYKISSITPGSYDVLVSFVGYKPIKMTGVVINSNKITFLDLELESTDVVLEEFEVIHYQVPLIDKDGGASGGTVTRDDISKMPGRSATSIATTVGGVYQNEGSGALSVRGSRSDATYYYIDGIKVRGSTGLPKSAIEEVSVITGGLPANYGDATGGIISITTRGPSSFFFGGVEALSSGFKFGDNTYGLDHYGYNVLEGSLSGPLLMRKDSTGKKTTPILGFFISGNFTSQVEPRPSALGNWVVKDSVREALIEAPLRPTGTGFGAFYNTDFLRMSDFEKENFRRNVQSNSLSLAGKIDVNTAPTVNLSFGGSMDKNWYEAGSYADNLFNYDNNPHVDNISWRVYGKFTQRFNQSESEEESKSIIKNAYYTVMADYSKTNQTVEDSRHKDKLLNYGYVGKFTTYRQNGYEPYDEDNDGTIDYLRHVTFDDTLVTFEASEINRELAAVTSQYFTLYDEVENNYENFTQILDGNGLLNGMLPTSVYSIWNNIGTQYNGYSKTDNSQFRITATGSADIGNHAISLGFEFEQRTDRFFSVSPVGLWTRMRALANDHIREIDTSKVTIEYFGTFQRRTYERLNASEGEYDAFDDVEAQRFFDYNLRNLLGLDPDGTDYIDVDAIGEEYLLGLDNEELLSMFSADELLNDGNQYVDYYGYSFNGEKSKSTPSFDDFFTERDDYGNFTRPVAPFEPIYFAAFLMDKFAFDDLIFNVGVRVDRFDANQKVLKDKYLLYEAKTVSEVDAGTFGVEHPTTMGDDYIVYVDDVNNPTTINGYRNGTQWYDANGAQISDPSTIEGTGGIAPYLLDPSQKQISSSAFEDYEPQIIVMPRIAFSFPISDEALFFAHYDVLAKRPTSGNRLNIFDYYYMENRSVIINNPNLKPEKTIDYELGFQQVLSKTSSLKISAFYREQRDNVALVNVSGAYPRTYRSWDNIDFGTVKGVTIAYDLRRTGNLRMNASYTLQFAEGTGSDATSALNLVNSGQPNLRTIFPYSYDQRHAIVATIDYRYGDGEDYNGPVWFGKKIFENTGANFVTNLGSGTPYSAQNNITPDAAQGGSGFLKGSINGSRKPGTFRVDAQIDRNFTLKMGKEDNPKSVNLNVYLLVNNLFNNLNIINVYRATGNPDDDGYLQAAEFQAVIAQKNDEQSYRDMYALKMNNPYNYGLPRTIRLGVKMDF